MKLQRRNNHRRLRQNGIREGPLLQSNEHHLTVIWRDNTPLALGKAGTLLDIRNKHRQHQKGHKRDLYFTEQEVSRVKCLETAVQGETQRLVGCYCANGSKNQKAKQVLRYKNFRGEIPAEELG